MFKICYAYFNELFFKRRATLSIYLLMTILLILLISLFFLNSVNVAAQTLLKKSIKSQAKITEKLFFYKYIHRFFFPNPPVEELIFSDTFAQNLLRFIYPIITIFLLTSSGYTQWPISFTTNISYFVFNGFASLGILLAIFFVFFLIGEYFSRIIGSHYPEPVLNYFAPMASLFMVIVFPVTFVFIKLSHLFSRTIYYTSLKDQATQDARKELIDLIEETANDMKFDPHDKKLLTSVMAFKDRIAREVMVPRVDVFGLAHDTTIEEAANYLVSEGYSRIPVFNDTLDDVVGVLMYKDILLQYMEFVKTNDRNILEATIETLVKNIIYTPETKKISHLLQEFRKKQVHLAIIVDEYGGTEGIVTIEDILEEIVGDIADEYDDEEEALYFSIPEGGWLIDPRMSIFEIKDHFDIEIPQSGDYDTVGGYVFHETGTIPQKGYIINQPTFKLEVIRSNDRRVEKLKIEAITEEDESDHPPPISSNS